MARCRKSFPGRSTLILGVPLPAPEASGIYPHLVTFSSFTDIRTIAESIHPRWRICAVHRTSEAHSEHIAREHFDANMEQTSSFSVSGADGIVSHNMFQDRNPSSGERAAPRTFSAQDREDAARLLSLIVGEERALRIRVLENTTEVARALLEDRRRRDRIFNPGMFGEPAWELLLNLYVMDKDGPRLTIGRLIDSTNCPQSTALRWLQYLKDQGLIEKQEHPGDARTAFITLTNKARDALDRYLSQSLAPRL
jgi:DNA-binding MarR family transcriptional regulator